MVLLLDETNLLIAHFDLGAVSNDCLVIEWRVKVDVFVGDVEHSLEKQLDIGRTRIVLQHTFILINLLELFQYKFAPR